MNIVLFIGVAFGLSMISSVLWVIGIVFEDVGLTSWIFGYWLAFLCLFAARYFTGV